MITLTLQRRNLSDSSCTLQVKCDLKTQTWESGLEAEPIIQHTKAKPSGSSAGGEKCPEFRSVWSWNQKEDTLGNCSGETGNGAPVGELGAW